MQERTTKAALAAVVLSAALIAAPLGTETATAATTSPFKLSFAQNFTTAMPANGPFAQKYIDSWQPYPDGMGGGMYWSGSQVSTHDGMMDVTLDGKRGAAGTFGSRVGAWGAVGGKFTVRARATGGDGNGAAFILWPTSNVWSEGEIDFPESNFEDSPMLHQHSMTPGKEDLATSVSTRASWRDWHTYAVEWIPGKSVKYYLDDKLLTTVTRDVPRTPHRFMFQVGNWGAKGHLYIDSVSTYTYKP